MPGPASEGGGRGRRRREAGGRLAGGGREAAPPPSLQSSATLLPCLAPPSSHSARILPHLLVTLKHIKHSPSPPYISTQSASSLFLGLAPTISAKPQSDNLKQQSSNSFYRIYTVYKSDVALNSAVPRDSCPVPGCRAVQRAGRATRRPSPATRPGWMTRPEDRDGSDEPGLPATCDEPGLPATCDEPGLPATCEEPGLPAICDEPGLPATCDEPGIPTKSPGLLLTLQPGQGGLALQPQERGWPRQEVPFSSQESYGMVWYGFSPY